ncbi:hypothetical protein CPB84DRAFT_1854197 [Gymnopilus junonius]|uniref:Uncharacterized protein n=1 Tax=Gymnopilus junonius TaxID=109634 RepID=A0A9P5TF32_GYMJU|nr:hypothetical protein CPB84DRAFT_1854197 [Gymnopilus junonius]
MAMTSKAQPQLEHHPPVPQALVIPTSGREGSSSRLQYGIVENVVTEGQLGRSGGGSGMMEVRKTMFSHIGVAAGVGGYIICNRTISPPSLSPPLYLHPHLEWIDMIALAHSHAARTARIMMLDYLPQGFAGDCHRMWRVSAGAEKDVFPEEKLRESILKEATFTDRLNILRIFAMLLEVAADDDVEVVAVVIQQQARRKLHYELAPVWL